MFEAKYIEGQICSGPYMSIVQGQICPGPNILRAKYVQDQICSESNMFRTKYVEGQICSGPILLGPNMFRINNVKTKRTIRVKYICSGPNMSSAKNAQG